MTQQPIDLFELEEQIRQQVSAEYEPYRRRVAELEKQAETHRMKWNSIAVRCSDSLNLPAGEEPDADQVLDELVRLLKVAKDFEVIVTAVKDNEILKTQWDKLLMSMRLVQQ